MTEIVTVHEENKKPETTVTVVESEVPQEEIDELVFEKSMIQKSKPSHDEILSEVKITEVVTEDKTPEKVVKKRTIKKRIGKKQEKTEIVTVYEENKEPEITVTVVESEIPQEEIDELITEKSIIQKSKPSMDEILSEVKITEVVTEDKTPERVVKKRTIKKRVGKKQEVTEKVTFHEEHKELETTVTVVESEVPQEEIDDLLSEKSIKQKSKPTIDEILSEVKITEVVTEGKIFEKIVKKKVI